MTKQLFSTEVLEDLYVSGEINGGRVKLGLDFDAVKQLSKVEAKIAGKSGLGYKIAGYVLDFAQVYLAKNQAESVPVAGPQ